jgi:hypothetical protein
VAGLYEVSADREANLADADKTDRFHYVLSRCRLVVRNLGRAVGEFRRHAGTVH